MKRSKSNTAGLVDKNLATKQFHKKLEAAQFYSVLTSREAADLYALHLKATAAGGTVKVPKRIREATEKFQLFVAPAASNAYH